MVEGAVGRVSESSDCCGEGVMGGTGEGERV